MGNAVDPAQAAAQLADLWRTGRQIRELPPEIRPRSLEEGYDIQDALIADLGEPVAGWKLGVGSAKLKAQSGIGRSIAGRVLRSRLYEPGDAVPLPGAAPVTVEFEVAYVLGQDVAPDGPARPPLDCVGEIRVTFELVLARFVDRRAVGWPSFAADNAGFHALVLGPAVAHSDLPALLRTLVVSVDGQERARAAAGDDATDPATALADLFALARERGMTLPAGSIVSTGSASLPFAMAGADAEVSAAFLDRTLLFRTRLAR
ncbi:MAG: fumarylacetoacetate hydrolase family protein [Actinomycetospora chiangmaiensis]|nr:fumarylacetoacetate hydrolase family protein [Actinomycetospora chiangmaiensis]